MISHARTDTLAFTIERRIPPDSTVLFEVDLPTWPGASLDIFRHHLPDSNTWFVRCGNEIPTVS